MNFENKYDTIGMGYNETRKADAYLVDRIVSLLDPNPNDLLLDIGCGTGNYTKALNKLGYNIIGIDPSKEMLSKASDNSFSIKWKQATAEKSGLDDNSIDGILASFTIHHWMDLTNGFNELYRVSKQNASLVILTATPYQMQGYWLNHYFPLMMEKSNQQMPSLELVSELLCAAGFKITEIEPYHVRQDLEDFFLYSGKHHPERYLDPNFRKGISSFSSLADMEEIKLGLSLLENDIRDDTLDEVIADYSNNRGDYLFIKSEKL